MARSRRKRGSLRVRVLLGILLATTSAVLAIALAAYLQDGNWKRPPAELDFLMHLLQQYMIEERTTIMRQNIQVAIIGRREGIPDDVLREIDQTVSLSSRNTGLRLCLAINYGGRAELADAVRRIAEEVKAGKLDPADLTEKLVAILRDGYFDSGRRELRRDYVDRLARLGDPSEVLERVIGPDSTILVDFMLCRLTRILENLVVHPERMVENLNAMRGLIFSQQVLMTLAEAGLERQKAYEMVQRNALRVWETQQDFKTLLLEDQEIRAHLSKEQIEDLFNLDYHLKHVDRIFERVFT